MISSERKQIITDRVNTNGVVYTKDLMELFHVSGETIRRDFKDLENSGLLEQVYGGAVKRSVPVQDKLPPYLQRAEVLKEEKMEIAQKAVSHVHEQMTIAMDSSTTNYYILQALLEEFSNLTILTNSLSLTALPEVKSSSNIILTGGLYVPEENCLGGPMAAEFLHNCHVDLYFMSCCGVSPDYGITDIGQLNYSVKKAMLSITDQVILVCPHDRFSVRALLKVCDIDAVNLIITDHLLTEDIKKKYQNIGIPVY